MAFVTMCFSSFFLDILEPYIVLLYDLALCVQKTYASHA